MNPPHTPDLSVVVLCYRSENYIREFIRQLEDELTREKIDFELVLVANYDKNSDDKTPEIVKEISQGDPKIIVISRVKEGKMGWDMRSGLKAATGNNISVIDGDGQMPCSDIVLVYRIIKTGKYDLVKTFRAKRFDGVYRSLLSHIYNRLFRLLFHPDFHVQDVNSKPKIFTKEAFHKMNLVSNDWFTDAEIMLEAFRNNMRICDVSTVFFKNERRKSFVGFSTIWEFVFNLLYYKYKKK